MAGRITKSESQLKPDPRHSSLVLSKFINCVMVDGKKAVAQRCVYDALDLRARLDKEKDESMPSEAFEVFTKAIDNAKPNVEVRSKQVGGANYQVPMPVTSDIARVSASAGSSRPHGPTRASHGQATRQGALRRIAR